jgi:hypothetical protein
LALEYTPPTIATSPFAGNDEYKARLAGTRCTQKSQECRMRLALCKTMQVEATVDCLFAASDTRPHPPPKRHKRRRAFLADWWARPHFGAGGVLP